MTLVELLVVIVMIGILSGMAGIGWSRIQKLLVGRSAMAELRNALVLARSDATTRDRCSGVLLDPANRRYLRFVDSTGATGVSDGRYTSGERLLQGWKSLPKELVFVSVASSASSAPTTRGCGGVSSNSSSTAQSGTFAIVFDRDGSAMASLAMRLLPKSGSPDTFSIVVLPPGGLVAMGR